jgi:hypothetical protein
MITPIGGLTPQLIGYQPTPPIVGGLARFLLIIVLGVRDFGDAVCNVTFRCTCRSPQIVCVDPCVTVVVTPDTPTRWSAGRFGRFFFVGSE